MYAVVGLDLRGLRRVPARGTVDAGGGFGVGIIFTHLAIGARGNVARERVKTSRARRAQVSVK